MINHSSRITLIIIIFSAVIGICVTIIAKWISQQVAKVPEENRHYKDTPPIGFKILWFPIRIISYFLEPLLSEHKQTQHIMQLRQAGLDYTLSPSQFIAGKIVYAAISMLISYWIAHSFSKTVPFSLLILSGALGYGYLSLWRKEKIQARKSTLRKSLPFYLDIMTLCVEAGLNLQGALHHAILKGPDGILREEFQKVLRDIRAGKTRAESLRMMSKRLNEPAINSLTSAIIQAEHMGMNLAPILRTQSDQRRNERFLRAEKLAMEAPVKMLFPLIAFIFPCTFVVLFFPIVMKFMNVNL